MLKSHSWEWIRLGLDVRIVVGKSSTRFTDRTHGEEERERKSDSGMPQHPQTSRMVKQAAFGSE